MSDGNKFQRSDAATGNVRRPTVLGRNGATTMKADGITSTVTVYLINDDEYTVVVS